MTIFFKYFINNFFNTAEAIIEGETKFPNINSVITFKEKLDGVILTAEINRLPKKYKCK